MKTNEGIETERQTTFIMAAKSHVGMVRTNNEDNFQVSSNLDNEQMSWVNNELCELSPRGALLVVADGMGGMNAGEVASEIAIETVRNIYTPQNITDEVLKTRYTIERFMNSVITEADSRIKAAAIYYPWSDALTFGEDIMHQYPGQLNKVMNSDGEFAPPGYMIGFSGVGKGLANLKKHLGEGEYHDVLMRALDISPVNHVSENSAPCAIVHGIFEYGVQIPMNQSVRFFEALTGKNVKALLFCNNLGPFGADPEVQHAVAEFLKAQVMQ